MKWTLSIIAVVAAAAAWWMVSASAVPDRPVALAIRLIDAVTGEPVRSGSVYVGEAREPLPKSSDGEAFVRADSGLRRSEWCRVAVSVEAVPGHAVARPVVDAFVGTFTDVAELTIPLRPTVDIAVDVRDGAGKPLEGAELFSACAGDEFVWWPRVASDSTGRLVVQRVPFVVGARVRVGVRRGDAWGQGETRFGDRPAGDVVLPVALVRDRIDPDLVYLMGGGNGVGPRVPRDFARPSGDAAVAVTLLRADATPHAGVALSLAGCERSIGDWRIVGTTDGAGRVEFRGVPEGACALNAWGRGFGPGDRKFDVVAGGMTARTLRESAGRTSVVTVVDEEGRAVPGAWVDAQIDSGEWDTRFVVQEEDGTQRLLPSTGSDGRVRLCGLPAVRLALRVERFSRTASAGVMAGEDATVVLSDVR